MGGAFFLSAACTVHPANGHARGSEGRRRIEQRMTREQIAEAQALARRCMASDYQDCD
jgi:hypothetical protein